MSKIILAGFLGAPGKAFPNTPQEYRDAKYLFKGEAKPKSSRFFSIALHDFLCESRRAPNRWLIMGTPKSIWDALFEVVPDEKWDEAFSQKQDEVSQALRAGTLKQDLLNEWGAELSRVLSKEIICYLTGEARDELEQQKVWTALEQNVDKGDEVIFDITHSLRHFAVIATFSVMLLRQLKDIQKVDVYYGALELSDKDENTGESISPVIHVPICQQLNQASEAVATYRHTGSFRPLGEAMKVVSLSIAEDTENVGFSDETNHPARDVAKNVLKSLNGYDFSQYAIERSLTEPLKEALVWVETHATFDAQLHHKAQEAYKRHQLFKAIAYLYEAITSAACRRYQTENSSFQPPAENSLSYFEYRKCRFQELKKATKNKTTSLKLNNGEQATIKLALECVEFLRNAVMHGTLSTKPTVKDTVNDALKNPQTFESIFNAGLKIYELVANGKLPVGSNCCTDKK